MDYSRLLQGLIILFIAWDNFYKQQVSKSSRSLYCANFNFHMIVVIYCIFYNVFFSITWVIYIIRIKEFVCDWFNIIKQAHEVHVGTIK